MPRVLYRSRDIRRETIPYHYRKESPFAARGNWPRFLAYDFLSCGKKDYRSGDWVLTFSLPESGRVGQMQWMYTDHVARVAPSDRCAYDKDYSYQAIQIWPPGRYEIPPKHLKPLQPPKRLLLLIRRQFKKEAR